MFQLDFDAIGTKWFIDILDLEKSNSEVLFANIIQLVKDFESKYSRFKDTSDVGILNNHKILTNPSEDLLYMLKTAEELRKVTEGSFNLLVGRQLSQLGYDKNMSFRLNSLAGEDSLELKFDKKKVVLGSNSLLDLGGIGKGYIIDRVVEFIKSQGLEEFSVNAGGDIFSQGKLPKTYYLENPFDNSQAIGEINLLEGSIACSSPSKRNWKIKDQVAHHLIDMKTKKPVEEIVSVFTYGKSVTQSDLGSTAIFVSNPELWDKISNHLDIEFLVVFKDGRYYQTEKYPGKMYVD